MQQLDKLLEAIQSSSKYRHIDIDLIRAIGTSELEKRRTLKEAIKATKNKLHQVGGAYQEESVRYDAWLAALQQAAQTGDKEQLKATCKDIMRHHASTRERLSFLEEFYNTIFGQIGPVSSIMDIACGLNPLSIPWMPLTGQTSYFAYDIYQDLMDFLSAAWPYPDIQGHAETRDVLQYPPTQEVDVALLLKAIPCLEQLDKAATRNLLESISAKYLVVSFPAKSLGGRNKGMVTYYESHFVESLVGENTAIERYIFPTELVFIVKR